MRSIWNARSYHREQKAFYFLCSYCVSVSSPSSEEFEIWYEDSSVEIVELHQRGLLFPLAALRVAMSILNS